MRLVSVAPGQPRVPEQLPYIPPVDHRYAPPKRRRLPGSLVWVLVLAGAIAGTMWMSATPPEHNCVTTPKVNECTLQKVYLAQGTKVIAGAVGGLGIALLLEGVAGVAAPPRRRSAPAVAAAAPKMVAPEGWARPAAAPAVVPQLRLVPPVPPRPTLKPGSVTTRMPVAPRQAATRFPRPASVPSAMDVSSLPPALRAAVIVPPTPDPTNQRDTH